MSLFATSAYGATVLADSIFYASTAESLRAGRGFTQFNGTPLQLWPPGFSLVLTALPGDPYAAARWLNAALYGSTVALGGLTLLRLLGRSLWTYAGILALTFSTPLLFVSTWVLSDSLFACLCAGFLLALLAYRERPTWKMGLVLAVIAGAAWLTRYIGVAVVISGVAMLATNASIPFRREERLDKATSVGQKPHDVIQPVGNAKTRSTKLRLARVATFIVIACLPMALWQVRLYFWLPDEFVELFALGTRTSVDGHLALVRGELADWLAPLSAWWLAMPLIAGMVAVCLLRPTVRPLALFTAVYVVVLVAAAAAQPFNAIGTRLLAPVYVPLVVLAVVTLKEAASQDRFVTYVASPLVVGLACWWVVANGASTASMAYRASVEGGGWYETSTAHGWATDLFAATEALDGPVYSNVSALLYYRSGVTAYEEAWMWVPARHGLPADGWLVYVGRGEPAYETDRPFVLAPHSAFSEGKIYRVVAR